MSEMEELEKQFKDVIGRMRRMSQIGDDVGDSDEIACTYREMSVFADRLYAQLEKFRKELTEAGYLFEGDDCESVQSRGK